MKYAVPKGVTAIYEGGKGYLVKDGMVEIPGDPVDWLKPVEEDPANFSSLKVEQLKELCAERGIEVPVGTKKAEIVALLSGE